MKVTKRQLNLIIENYLLTEMKFGTDRFEFSNACDMSDIEFTKGFKAVKEFLKDRNVQETNKKIREIEAAINNPPVAAGSSPDDFVSDKISELEIQKEKMKDLTAKVMGPFGFGGSVDRRFIGLTSPIFQKNLMQLLGFGMMLTVGPSSALYCNAVRSVVKVLNASLESAVGTQRKEEKYETIEFDFFYNALDAVSNPVIRDLTNNSQFQIWTKTIESLNISNNALSLFKYIYCMTGKEIDIMGATDRTEADYYDKVKDASRNYIQEIKNKIFERNGKGAGGPSLKSDFEVVIKSNPDREDLIQELVSFIDRRGYGAQGIVKRSNFTNLNKAIAEKSAQEKDFYDNLIGHIKGTLNSVPG